MQARVDTIQTEIDRTEMNVNVQYRCYRRNQREAFNS